MTLLKYLTKILWFSRNMVNMKVKDLVPLFPKSSRTANLVTCSSRYDFCKCWIFIRIQDSLVSFCYIQLWSILWPRFILNQPICLTWKMKIFISPFQNVQELGIWIKGTQVMNLIRQHGRMNFYMYATLVQTLKSDFSCNPMRLNASKLEISELNASQMRSDGCFMGLTYCIQWKSGKVHQKSTIPLIPFLSHLILDFKHWRGMFTIWIMLHWGKEVMITNHYSKIKSLNARYFARFSKNLRLKSSTKRSAILPIKETLLRLITHHIIH